MFVRKDLGMTLADAREILSERVDNAEVLRVEPEQIRYHFDDTDPHISLGDTSVPVTETAMKSIGSLLQVPTAFLSRAQEKAQPATINALLSDLTRNTLRKEAKVTMVKGQLQSIEEWGGRDPIRPIALVDTAIKVIDETAPLARWVDEPDFFGFDVYAPEGFAHGYGGEGVAPYADGNERDDITAGGLRMGINLKQGLAPFTQTWFYRLACTNGYETENAGLKIDARGSSAEEVIAELEEMAQIAFSAAEREIASFYELKNQPVENVERTIRTIARERGIPDRSTMALMDLAVSEDMPENPSMFDVVNLITNLGNSMTRDGGRLLLERAGGSVVSDHTARCSHCQQKVH